MFIPNIDNPSDDSRGEREAGFDLRTTESGTTYDDCTLDDLTFDNAADAIAFLAKRIRRKGNAELGGIEEEVQILGPDGKPVVCAQHTEFARTVAYQFPKAREAFERGRTAERRLKNEGKVLLEIGSIMPETCTSLLELAHMPQKSSWDTHGQAAQYRAAVAAAAEKCGLVAIGAGSLPTVDYRDFNEKTIIKLKEGKHWHEWMAAGTHQRQCRTVFGTASVHHNQGFNDPELMAQYMTMVVRLQPTMIALLGNAPLWNGQTMACGTSRDATLLTHRGRVQLAYDRNPGTSGLRSLYPDFLLDMDAKFHNIVLGFMNLPLGHTFVDNGSSRWTGEASVRGAEVECGNLTMLQYLKGYDCDEGICFPGPKALQDMLHDPVIDVRTSMVSGARVETRAHDCVSSSVAVSLDALYRGLNQRLGEARDLMRGLTPKEVRLQRVFACWHGLQTPVAHIDDRIGTQQDLAKRALEIAARGLSDRGLGEEALLAPLQSIAETGINPAERMLKLWRDCTGDLPKFFDRIRYDDNSLAGDYRWPAARPAAAKASGVLAMAAG